VEIADRDPTDAQKLAGELGDCATPAGQRATPLRGDMVVFAVYYPGIKDAVREYADQLAGKVVVDGATSPRQARNWLHCAYDWN
jgi:predicted dinucleotide-binding enzyme